jgi:hypothetical protein
MYPYFRVRWFKGFDMRGYRAKLFNKKIETVCGNLHMIFLPLLQREIFSKKIENDHLFW